MERIIRNDLVYKPLTPAEWPDFETLFQEHGPQNGCWCMYWRISRKEWQRNFGEGNRNTLHGFVEAGNKPGILAYHDGHAVGWCSIAPRETHLALERSRTLRRIDDLPVWSITCFVVSKPYQKMGLMEALIVGAIAYAREQRAKIIEAYPLRAELTGFPINEQYMGIQSTLERAGFRPAAQRSARRVILRYPIQENQRR